MHKGGNKALHCWLIECQEMLTACSVTASQPANTVHLIDGHSRTCCRVMRSNTAKLQHRILKVLGLLQAQVAGLTSKLAAAESELQEGELLRRRLHNKLLVRHQHSSAQCDLSL